MLKSKQKQPERIDAYPIGININKVHDFIKNIREFGSHDGSLGDADISAEDLGIREAVQLHFHNLKIRVLSLAFLASISSSVSGPLGINSIRRRSLDLLPLRFALVFSPRPGEFDFSSPLRAGSFGFLPLFF